MSEIIEHNEMTEQGQPQISLGTTTYEHIKTRAYTPVSVYKGNDEFLRIGPKDLISPELDLHKKLLSYGFPVAAIKNEGEREGKFYYIEQSLGEELLGDLFWEDFKKEGRISNEHFSSLLNVSEQFAKAQLKTLSEDRDEEGFYIGIHTNFLLEELPEYKADIMAAFEKLKARTAGLPDVLTHGDFNAYNIFKDGVIDFGNAHNAPAGYDIVSNIYHTYNFPKPGDYESTRRYSFSEEQINEYFAAMDRIYTDAGLPKLSDFKEDYILAKVMWSTTREHKNPRLQKWRYDRFKKILSEYLSGKSIMQTTLEF